MTRRSSLASLQQAITLGLLAVALAWLLSTWNTSPVLALAGALAIVFAHGFFLALECLLLLHVSRSDTTARPTLRELARAWWAELLHVPVVFFWRQPFRWQAEPDQLGPGMEGRRGIVFIHGFICNRGFWTPWMKRLRASGHAFAAVNLEPVFGSIDDYAAIIDESVRKVTAASGMPPVLVCHSMGGLAARAWLRRPGKAARVERVITIGTPHQGTWLARFSWLANGRQMRLHGSWVRALAADEAQHPRVPFTCWYSHCDHIVFPASCAMLPGADNRLVRGPAHVELAFRPEVVEGSLALLEFGEYRTEIAGNTHLPPESAGF